jgi:ADP-heptose:LPS heptosyltransferase
LISTSCKEIAQGLLDQCLRGENPATLPYALTRDECSHALFAIWVEGLADRFEPAYCDIYARLFAQAVAAAVPGCDAVELVARYNRVRRVRRVQADPRRVVVLSRVTLGADIAVTSVLLDGARRRFRKAEILFAGPAKNHELFGGVRHLPIDYRRGTLRERLAAWDELKSALDEPDCIVLDPDSRLTQLGLLPVCDDERYYFFESRAYGEDGERALSELAQRWVAETLSVAEARPWMAVPKAPPAGIAVSFGVGENPAKRLPDPFEEKLLALLAGTGLPMTIDAGAGGEESERVRRAVERSGAQVKVWDGSFAGFASIIAASKLYVGYDSAGQHAAAAAGVPLISIFAGFASPRMFHRWQPVAPNATVLRVDEPDVDAVLQRVKAALP